jgi:CheY-like chemotaxis protein
MAARRILLIEDEPAARDGLARLLAEEGHEICAVDGGAGAIERLRDFQPDTVISDFYLGDQNGLQVLRQARALAKMPITFILITAGCGGAEMEAVLQREADHFFPKPVDLAKLRRILGEPWPTPPSPAVVAASRRRA